MCSVGVLVPLLLERLSLSVLGLRRKALVARGLPGGFCEQMPEASPMSDRAGAAGSKTNSPLAKPEPVS